MSTRIVVSKLTTTDARPKETALAVGCLAACSFSLVVLFTFHAFSYVVNINAQSA